MDYHIRKAKSKDKEQIVSIFNYYVENSYAAYPEHKADLDFFDKLTELATGYPLYVIDTTEGEAVGFGLMRPYHNSETFRRTAKLTYFIHPAHTRKGLGTRLLNALTEKAKQMDINTVLADISSKNPASIDFHKKNGFQECGRFKRVGKKFGKDFDVIWMQKFIK
ncbi:MAG: N-acetyltransferase family protein [Candidatus Bathyarchaeia archaeon]|jgi:phosphinothricin acetyltransferase